MRSSIFLLGLMATPLLAADGPAAEVEAPVACLPAHVVVPPFNNTAEAMEQSRIAATVVMDADARAGKKAVRVCRKSAVAPRVSEIEGVNEVPVDPEYEAGPN